MASTGEAPSRKTGTVTIVIDNFSEFNEVGKYEELKISEYSLRFGMNQRIFSRDDYFASIFVANRSEMKTFSFHLNVSILTKGYKVYSKEYEAGFDEQNGCIPFTLMRHSLLTSKNGYLHKDKLILLCEIELFDNVQRNEKLLALGQQQDLSNLSADFQTLMSDDKFCDATLLVGTARRELHVHKNILAARSPVFAAMFDRYSEEKRMGKMHRTVMEIADINQDVIEEMLRFIYTGKVKSLDRYAMDLLAAADKYQINSLNLRCMQYLSLNLTTENASKVLLLADMHNAVELKAHCIEFISRNAVKVEATEGWKVLNSVKPQLGGGLFMHLAKKQKY